MSTPKKGEVLETYQGQFFKVVEVKDGMYGRTAFHYKQDAAAADDVIVVWVNAYGLGQVLKKAAAKTASAKKAAAKTAEKSDE